MQRSVVKFVEMAQVFLHFFPKKISFFSLQISCTPGDVFIVADCHFEPSLRGT